MTTMDTMFEEREVVREAAGRWWIFLVTGIAWLVFSLIIFRFDITSVTTIGILFGVVAIMAGLNEFMAITVSTTGWKIAHGILGVIFVLVGISGYRVRTETGARTTIILVGVAATSVVLAFFAVDTFRNAPQTFTAIVGIGALSVILDLVWKRMRGPGPAPGETPLAPPTPS